MIDESDVIQRVLDGDTESFRLLVERYGKPVVGLIRNLTDDGQTCEDLAQDVFLAAYANLGTFDAGRSSFATWLFTIARNKSINALKRKRPTSLGTLPEQVVTSGPAQEAIRRESFARLDDALARLGTKQRTAFVLIELQGLSYEQAALVERTQIGTIKSRVSRAKTQLARVLERYRQDQL